LPAPRTPTCPPGAAPLIERPCRRFSQFDLTADARVLNGPAPRRLPALSVKVANGFPVVAGAFIGRPGFEPGGG
jgi:Rieske Fe-S protein